MKTKMQIGKPLRWLVLAGLALAWSAPAAETNTVLPVPSTNAVAAQPGTNRSQAVSSSAAGTLPRLQRRKAPELPRQYSVSPAEQAQRQAGHPALREMGTNRFAFGTNGAAGYGAFDPRAPFGPRRVPPAILQQYDANRNGVLDPPELQQYRQAMEKRRAERARLPGTNAPPVVVSTNQTGAK